jgi:hypothetical protein
MSPITGDRRGHATEFEAVGRLTMLGERAHKMIRCKKSNSQL